MSKYPAYTDAGCFQTGIKSRSGSKVLVVDRRVGVQSTSKDLFTLQVTNLSKKSVSNSLTTATSMILLTNSAFLCHQPN